MMEQIENLKKEQSTKEIYLTNEIDKLKGWFLFIKKQF